MIKEHECVILTEDLQEHQLQAGDVGTVIHVHKGGVGYELEFATLAGDTIAVVTVRSSQVRPINSRDLPHARELAAA